MMKNIIKHKNKIALFCLGLTFLLVPFLLTQATTTQGWAPKEITFDSGENILRNSKLGESDPVVVTAGIINWILGLLGLIALVLIIYGGFIWMLSSGNEEQVTKAKDIIVGAVIGLLIILASYGIASYVFNNLMNISTQ